MKSTLCLCLLLTLAALCQAADIAPEVVLVGDSITHFWGGEPKAGQANGPRSWQSTFGDYRTLNMGFGWDRIQNVLWRIDDGELDGLRPRVIVLHFGTNNTSDTANARQNTPAEIVEGIGAILQRIRAKTPAARVILMAVFRSGATPWRRCSRPPPLNSPWRWAARQSQAGDRRADGLDRAPRSAAD